MLNLELDLILIFRWRRGKLLAVNADDIAHEVPPQIKTIDEIIIYTQHYYDKLIEEM